MNRELLQQALNALLISAPLGHAMEDYEYRHRLIKDIEAELAKPVGKIPTLAEMKKLLNGEPIELAKPEQGVVPFPSFMRKRIEEAIDLAINPKGMSVHDGKATVYASDLQRMIAVIDLAPPRKEWVGLTDDEIEEAWGNTPMMLNARDGSSRKMFACTIQAKLKEKNT